MSALRPVKIEAYSSNAVDVEQMLSLREKVAMNRFLLDEVHGFARHVIDINSDSGFRPNAFKHSPARQILVSERTRQDMVALESMVHIRTINAPDWD